MRAGSLETLVCALEHENGVGDLEGGSELDAHDLHNVGLGQQQKGLAVNHLGRHRDNSGDEKQLLSLLFILSESEEGSWKM